MTFDIGKAAASKDIFEGSLERDERSRNGFIQGIHTRVVIVVVVVIEFRVATQDWGDIHKQGRIFSIQCHCANGI